MEPRLISGRGFSRRSWPGAGSAGGGKRGGEDVRSDFCIGLLRHGGRGRRDGGRGEESGEVQELCWRIGWESCGGGGGREAKRKS